MIHLIHCRFKWEETGEWIKGILISSDIDGQEGKEYIILRDSSVVTNTDKIWDIKVEHHYGHYNIDL